MAELAVAVRTGVDDPQARKRVKKAGKRRARR
jgi:hypothetical protein